MKFPNGTSVRVHAPGYSTHGRTGVVVDLALKSPPAAPRLRLHHPRNRRLING